MESQALLLANRDMGPLQGFSWQPQWLVTPGSPRRLLHDAGLLGALEKPQVLRGTRKL